ncbi:MAG: F0F1 ATP synthase subunit A [Actinobacteria bacterium]|nr:F0F1 ATP synthase subunit A [Actinomycetota bacterium]
MSSLASALLVADGGESGGFHAPSIAEFFPQVILFQGTPYEFDRVMLVRVIAAVALVVFMVVVARRATLVPGRAQAAVEWLMDFVRKNVAEEVLGVERARQFTPLLTTLFFSILTFNITGVVIFMNIAGTSRIGLPVLFALVAYVTYLAAGIQAKGVGGFLKSSLFPPGVPWFMYVLLTPIEILQVFILRPATLAIRLMANMVAGHLMLVLCFSATQFFLLSAGPALKAFGIVTFGAGIALTGFEIFVAALQAYIFVILTAVYIDLSVSEEH